MAKNDDKQLNTKPSLRKSMYYKRGRVNSHSLVFSVNNEPVQDVQHVDQGYMRQTTEKALKQKTSKGKIINIVCFALSILILVVSLVIQRETFGVTDVTNLKINTKYLWYTVLVFVAIMTCDSLRTHVLVYRSTGQHRPFVSYKSTAICRYYDCITPFSFGGQPFQIYYLSTRGVRGGIASSVPLAKYIFSQISFCIMALVLLIIGLSKAMFSVTESTTIITFSIISLALCFLFLGAIFFISISKKITPRVVWWLIKVAHKFRIVKNREIAFTHSMRTIMEYQRSIWYYLKSFWTSAINFALSVGMLFLKGLIPYLIYLTFVPVPTVPFMEILIKFMVCELVTMFIPLPGGSGMAELSFTALFASLFADTYIFWAMLLYRIFTYYIYLAQGIVVNIYDLIIGDRNNQKYLINKAGK